MGIEIKHVNNRFGCRAICDVCRAEVEDGKCNVLTQRRIDLGNSDKIQIACKGECTDTLDPERKLANQELGTCVVQLIANAKIDVAETSRRAAAIFAAFGGTGK